MTNAKDYVKAREEYSTPTKVPTLEELKKLIEVTIDNGKEDFISKGYIPIRLALADRIYSFCSAQGNFMIFDKSLRDWLEKYNWQISTNLNETSHLVLVAIKT